jgi:DNA-binding NarL/FixJ family response regulator
VERARQLRVVVADDHQELGKAATGLLAPTCDVVATVRDGASAIAATSEFKPDVVVLDIAMPGLDGFQTASRIQASGSPARIVFLSNFAGDDFVLAGVTRGASGFVSKSEMHRDLAEAVSHVAEGRWFVPSASVLPQWRRAAGHRHDLLPYATDEHLVNAVTGFVDSALEAGDSIVAVVSPRHRQALDAEFERRGVDVAALTGSGRYTAVGSSMALESILAGGVPDAGLFAAAMEPLVQRGLSAATGSSAHVTVFGEIAPLLGARGDVDAMLALEQIASEYTATRPVSILCCYSTGRFEDAAMHAGICGHHSTVVSASPTR